MVQALEVVKFVRYLFVPTIFITIQKSPSSSVKWFEPQKSILFKTEWRLILALVDNSCGWSVKYYHEK